MPKVPNLREDETNSLAIASSPLQQLRGDAVADTDTKSRSPLKSLAYGLLGESGGAVIDSIASGVMSAIRGDKQRDLMREQTKQQREVTRTQMSDERESYINAGLSPALLAEGGFSPAQVSAPTPAQQNVHGQNTNTTALLEQAVMGNTLKEQQSNINLVDAQTQGQLLKNDEQRIVNDRLTDEDEFSNDSIRLYMSKIIEQLPEGSELRDSLEGKFSSSDWRFSKGAVDGARQFVDLLQSDSDFSASRRKNELDGIVYSVMRNDPSIVASIANMPKVEVAKADAYIKEVSSIISRNVSEIALNASQGKLNARIMDKVSAEIRSIGYQIESAQLGDSRYLLKHGRGADLAANVFMNAMDFSADVAKMYVGAKAFGSGRLAQAGRSVAPTTEKAFKQLPKVAHDPVSLSKHEYLSPRELARIPISERRKMASIEFRQFQTEHPRYGSKRLQSVKEQIGNKYGIFKNPQNKLR